MRQFKKLLVIALAITVFATSSIMVSAQTPDSEEPADSAVTAEEQAEDADAVAEPAEDEAAAEDATDETATEEEPVADPEDEAIDTAINEDIVSVSGDTIELEPIDENSAIDEQVLEALVAGDSTENAIKLTLDAKATSGKLTATNEFPDEALCVYKFDTKKALPHSIEFSHKKGSTEKSFCELRVYDSNFDLVDYGYPGDKQATATLTTEKLESSKTYYVLLYAENGVDTGFGKDYTITAHQGTPIGEVNYNSKFLYNGKTQKSFKSAYSNTPYKKLSSSSYNVTGNSAKAIGKYTLKVTGKGNYYGTITATYTVNPDTAFIQTSKSKNLSGKKIKIVWSKVKQVTKYQIHYKKTTDKNWKVKTIASSKSSYTFTKLTKGKTYQFYITDYKTVKSVKIQGYYNDISKKYEVLKIKVKK
jgi:hypothetical protein